jgi:hypothetical protein
MPVVVIVSIRLVNEGLPAAAPQPQSNTQCHNADEHREGHHTAAAPGAGSAGAVAQYARTDACSTESRPPQQADVRRRSDIPLPPDAPRRGGGLLCRSSRWSAFQTRARHPDTSPLVEGQPATMRAATSLISPWDSLWQGPTGREGEPVAMVEYCIRCGRQAPSVDSSAYMFWVATAADDLVYPTASLAKSGRRWTRSP